MPKTKSEQLLRTIIDQQQELIDTLSQKSMPSKAMLARQKELQANKATLSHDGHLNPELEAFIDMNLKSVIKDYNDFIKIATTYENKIVNIISRDNFKVDEVKDFIKCQDAFKKAVAALADPIIPFMPQNDYHTLVLSDISSASHSLDAYMTKCINYKRLLKQEKTYDTDISALAELDKIREEAVIELEKFYEKLQWLVPGEWMEYAKDMREAKPSITKVRNIISETYNPLLALLNACDPSVDRLLDNSLNLQGELNDYIDTIVSKTVQKHQATLIDAYNDQSPQREDHIALAIDSFETELNRKLNQALPDSLKPYPQLHEPIRAMIKALPVQSIVDNAFSRETRLASTLGEPVQLSKIAFDIKRHLQQNTDETFTYRILAAQIESDVNKCQAQALQQLNTNPKDRRSLMQAFEAFTVNLENNIKKSESLNPKAGQMNYIANLRKSFLEILDENERKGQDTPAVLFENITQNFSQACALEIFKGVYNRSRESLVLQVSAHSQDVQASIPKRIVEAINSSTLDLSDSNDRLSDLATECDAAHDQTKQTAKRMRAQYSNDFLPLASNVSEAIYKNVMAVLKSGADEAIADSVNVNSDEFETRVAGLYRDIKRTIQDTVTEEFQPLQDKYPDVNMNSQIDQLIKLNRRRFDPREDRRFIYYVRLSQGYQALESTLMDCPLPSISESLEEQALESVAEKYQASIEKMTTAFSELQDGVRELAPHEGFKAATRVLTRHKRNYSVLPNLLDNALSNMKDFKMQHQLILNILDDPKAVANIEAKDGGFAPQFRATVEKLDGNYKAFTKVENLIITVLHAAPKTDADLNAIKKQLIAYLGKKKIQLSPSLSNTVWLDNEIQKMLTPQKKAAERKVTFSDNPPRMHEYTKIENDPTKLAELHKIAMEVTANMSAELGKIITRLIHDMQENPLDPHVSVMPILEHFSQIIIAASKKANPEEVESLCLALNSMLDFSQEAPDFIAACKTDQVAKAIVECVSKHKMSATSFETIYKQHEQAKPYLQKALFKRKHSDRDASQPSAPIPRANRGSSLD